MEPWLFSHGYLSKNFSRYFDDTGLQWSHGFSAMDTSELRDKIGGLLAPSMEPWLFSHGYEAMGGIDWMNTKPSMEPWLFSHGYND